MTMFRSGGVDARRAALAATLAVPPLLLAVAEAQGAPPLLALAGIAAITAGLLVVHDGLRHSAFAPVATPTCLLVLYATSLVWHAARETSPAAAVFLAGAVLARAFWSRTWSTPARAVGPGALLGVVLLALALTAEAGRTRVSVSAPALLDSLFSSRHGVLFWTPALTLALAGLVFLALRGRGVAWGTLTALAVAALGNASLRPWWTGDVANARVLPVLPLLALGLAALLEGVRTTASRRPLRALATAGGLLVAWNLLFMAQYRRGVIPRDDTVSFPAVVENSARTVADTVGSPTAWPANWIFAARHGLPAARFDLLAGQDVLAAGPVTLDVGDLATDGAVLLEGWSVRHRCGDAVCREVEGRARAALPVVDPGPAQVEVRGRGTGTLRVSLAGAAPVTAVLEGAFADVVLVAGAGLRRGPNTLLLEVSPGGQALIDAIRVVPLPGPP
jgi:hypothetical protein